MEAFKWNQKTARLCTRPQPSGPAQFLGPASGGASQGGPWLSGGLWVAAPSPTCTLQPPPCLWPSLPDAPGPHGPLPLSLSVCMVQVLLPPQPPPSAQAEDRLSLGPVAPESPSAEAEHLPPCPAGSERVGILCSQCCSSPDPPHVNPYRFKSFSSPTPPPAQPILSPAPANQLPWPPAQTPRPWCSDFPAFPTPSIHSPAVTPGYCALC